MAVLACEGQEDVQSCRGEREAGNRVFEHSRIPLYRTPSYVSRGGLVFGESTYFHRLILPLTGILSDVHVRRFVELAPRVVFLPSEATGPEKLALTSGLHYG